MRMWSREELLLKSMAPAHQVIGVDESGTSAYAGPVSAAAVEPDFNSGYSELVVDCKLLDKSELAEAYRDVIVRSRRYAVAFATAREVDSVGIVNATQLAMRRAVRGIIDESRPQALIIDYTPINGLHCVQYPLLDADKIAACVSAASIIAKYERDVLMEQLHQQYPDYGWDKNHGTCTRSHRDAVKGKGLTPFHRKTWTVKVIKDREKEINQGNLQSPSELVSTGSNDMSKLRESYITSDSIIPLDPRLTARSTRTLTPPPKSIPPVS